MKKIKYKNKFYKGVWFCGMSGSGKTYSSKYFKNSIKYSIIIDGDDVRKFISTDLDRTINSRLIQIHRLLGIALISIKSGLVPIVSGVYMNSKYAKKISQNNILIIKVERDLKFLKNHKTYKNKKNVVGVDIKYPKFDSIVLFNDSTIKYNKILNKFIK